MAHWDAFYQRSMHDPDYPSLSTTISAGVRQFNPAEFGGHAVANALGAFTASQPLTQPHEDDPESGSEFVSRPNIIMLIGRCVCMCVCVCVC